MSSVICFRRNEDYFKIFHMNLYVNWIFRLFGSVYNNKQSIDKQTKKAYTIEHNFLLILSVSDKSSPSGYGVPLRPKSSSHRINKMKRVQTLLNGQK